MTDKLIDIWEIYREIPGANIPDDGDGAPMCNDNWYFAEAIVDLIDRRIAEGARHD